MASRPGKAVNKRTGQPVALRVTFADTAWERTRGLIGRPRLEPDEGLCIRPCRQIHTFFMGYPIDAAFLDRDGRVVAAIESLTPFRISAYHPRAAFVLELPAGTLGRTDTRVGDRIEFLTDK